METKGDYRCWCGAESLHPYSSDYLRCTQCETLVSINRLADGDYEVSDDDADYYGKQYWFAHQTTDLVLPNVEERADSDLSGRCLWWLKTIMKYRLPGSAALDVGCSHGAMVFLLEQAGYLASGLELSRYIVDMAKEKFNVPIHCGPIDTLPAKPASLDVVCLFDVLEHLADPVATLKSCAELMTPDGVFVIQCPRFDPALTFEDLEEADSPFLRMLIPEEHLFLFSIESAKSLFEGLGFKHFKEESAYFSEHDMFFVASRKKLVTHSAKKIQSALTSAGRANQIQLLLRLFDSQKATESTLRTVELDREARLQRIDALTLGNAELASAAEARLELVDELTAQIKALGADLALVKTDRKLLLEDTKKLALQAAMLQKDLDASAADRKQLLSDIRELTAENARVRKQVEEIEDDRGKRVLLIQELTTQVESRRKDSDALAADRNQLLSDIGELTAENARVLKQVEEIEEDRTKRATLLKELSTQLEGGKKDIESLRADRQQMLLDTQKLTTDNRKLLEQVDALAADREQLLLDTEKLTSLNTSLRSELEAVSNDREDRGALVDRLSSELDGLEKKVDQVVTDREQILQDNQTLTVEIAKLRKELDEVNEDRSERLKVIETLAADVQLKAQALDEVSLAKSELELKVDQLEVQLSGSEKPN